MGFTLLEMLVVLTVLALASGLTALALRDGASQRLEQEGVRLAALLEAARLESRTTGRTISWSVASPMRPSPAGQAADFQFGDGAPMATATAARPATHSAVNPPDPLQRLPRRWLHEGTQAEVIGARVVVLGPDPILPPQRIRLRLGREAVVIGTDGLGPFRLESGAPP